MVHFKSIDLLAAALLILAVVQPGFALKCWDCSSMRDDYCNDHFSAVETNLNRVRLQECDYDRIHNTYSSNSKAVCIKQRQRETNGDVTTLRHCDWIYEQDGSEFGDCGHSTVPTDATVEFCETCFTDGCNGSPKNVLPATWSSILTFVSFTFYKKYNM